MADFRIIIDADACPKACLQIVQKLAVNYHYEVVTIASFNHQIISQNHHIVGDEPQATDIAIINQSRSGDIVITQDWGLAAIVLAKNVKAISPSGKIYDPNTIDILLEERNVLAKYRKGGGRTKGPAKRSREDDARFENHLIRLINENID